MPRNPRTLAAASVLSAGLLLGACAGGSDAADSQAQAPQGEAVKGGTARIIEDAEPRSLDPAVIANSYANSPILGNALYGELLVDNPKTGEIGYRIAQSLTTDDGGTTFTLKLRPGVKFSDGTHFTAAAVKFAWEHVKDPNTNSPDLPQAALIKKVTATDDSTLRIELTDAVPRFANAVLQTSLNWVARPQSLQSGTIDTAPVGAGAYTLEQWSRQDVIKLKKNPGYWDTEHVNLDALEIRAVIDPDQRWNTLLSGGADLAMEGQWQNVDNAQHNGFQNQTLDFGGGIALVLNTRKPPFDDVRARQALAAALNLDTVNDAVFNGTGRVPDTLFDKSSTFYQDIPLQKNDPAQAQKLFDELAAEGRPVSFAVSLFPGSSALGNSIQTQLSQFSNVQVKVGTIDLAQYGTIMAKKDYDVITSSVTFGDPEPRLWFGLNGRSSGNYSGIDDPRLNASLDQGRTAHDDAERTAAYRSVQERLAELVPVIFYTRASPSVLAARDVGGITQYGFGSVLPENLWIQP
ncbi:hypothetical protein GCM10022223_31820 [Kineosporia mesophila]|uniref:Solute-binding protein family 5 domain-containing protein n=1 Tax=Kineosporia mesophila TaxID=566012 RepID=A0ABP6ZMC4_9ACTN|nr:ABC transporter substrate-binding protein [Kineosporia mesophila]MCD5354491.1 ABC transporter substrate-binding protein [Kineosporia mesophila]